jgi:hypothetical protein
MVRSDEYGARRRLSPARKFIADLVHFAQRVPSIPVARTMQLSQLAEARARCSSRPSWTALFIKAYGLVCQRHPRLRQAYIPWPWEHIYEHPISSCEVAIEREYQGEKILLATQVRAPERQSIQRIDAYLRRCKECPIDEIGYYRRALVIGTLPRLLRRFLWWHTLNFSGYKRAKRLGTFGVSSYGRLGAEQVHPISPLTTLLTFGPISSDGRVVVKIVYDHRVLDGSEIARNLAELEQTLDNVIVTELRAVREPKSLLAIDVDRIATD